MNKIYVSPFAVEVNVETESMLATSFPINGGDGAPEVGSGGQLSAGNRGWGDLWKK